MKEINRIKNLSGTKSRKSYMREDANTIAGITRVSNMEGQITGIFSDFLSRLSSLKYSMGENSYENLTKEDQEEIALTKKNMKEFADKKLAKAGQIIDLLFNTGIPKATIVIGKIEKESDDDDDDEKASSKKVINMPTAIGSSSGSSNGFGSRKNDSGNIADSTEGGSVGGDRIGMSKKVEIDEDVQGDGVQAPTGKAVNNNNHWYDGDSKPEHKEPKQRTQDVNKFKYTAEDLRSMVGKSVAIKRKLGTKLYGQLTQISTDKRSITIGNGATTIGLDDIDEIKVMKEPK
jgi:hypothetical protein